VRIVAPAGPVPAEPLRAGVARLERWGLEVTVAPHVLATHPTLTYLAGHDTDRAADLQQAWCDPQVDAVFCARGGYGCTRLLDVLDWSALAASTPKPLVGFSDVTALLHAFTTRLGVPTVFGPTLTSDSFTDATTVEGLHRCLFRPREPTVLTGGQPLAPGTAHGITTGGTATLLAALAGASGPEGHPPPGRTILLLEDVHESPYRLDRVLTQLARAGWLADAAGIAIGALADCGPAEALRDMLVDRLAGLGVPVAWDLPFGHRTPQASIRLGVPAHLDADAGRLTIC
jgi:muramoyltetrapeptide carboxypeptidase